MPYRKPPHGGFFFGEIQMPTYIYRCPKHRNISIEHGMREQATECPKCGSGIVRVYAPTPTLFKGGGFYKTEKR